MDYRTLRNIDLNLLIVLDVLLRERSVTLAAKKLGRTQSAVSHALSRLRSTFDDKLLVRVGSNMEPTPRAKNLQKDLQRLLSSLRRFMDDTEQFLPRESTKMFTLEIPDFLSPLLRHLFVRFEHEAPNASLLIKKSNYSLLDTGKGVTIRLLPMSLSIPMGLKRVEFASCHWRTFVRKNHPIVQNWNQDAWSKYGHIRYQDSSDSNDGLESAIKTVGASRPIKAAVETFSMAMAMVEESDCLFSCLCFSNEMYNPNLISLPVPFTTQDIKFGLVSSETLEQDGGKKWFDDLLRSSLSRSVGID